MDLFFQSAGELCGIFKSLGIGLDVSQLSAGSLHGRFQ
ncbi:transcriptional regulator, AraC family [Synechococcus sp. WH 8103]|nr:transcriptional regulator, AraC family [Synechococcus sp. WH 8103]